MDSLHLLPNNFVALLVLQSSLLLFPGGQAEDGRKPETKSRKVDFY